MFKVVLELLFFVTPLLALRLPQAAETIDPEDPQASIDPGFSLSEGDGVRVLRKMGGAKKHTWIMFYGDSNMRNTYNWWVTNRLNKTATKLMHSKEFGLGSKWNDQEVILEYPDGYEIRASLRFIHGSAHEFKFKTTNYHSASQAVNVLTDKQYDNIKLSAEEKNKAQSDDVMDDPNAIQPSQFAKSAAQHQSLINFKASVPFMAPSLEKYADVKPEVVVLTEGWGGMPACDRFSEVKQWFKKDPEVKFVWSPIFFTNRLQTRHDCFSKKIQKSEEEEPGKKNFKFLDMWDVVSKSGVHQTSIARTPEQTVHMAPGGYYMKKALSRIESAIDDLAN